MSALNQNGAGPQGGPVVLALANRKGYQPMEANQAIQLIPVRTLGETFDISSLDFAEGLGIHHKNLLTTLRTHKEAIERAFGRVAFETRPIETAGGLQKGVVAHLTEDQALFVGTLSRNSQRVVEFKATLVRSFSEARRRQREANQQLLPSEQLNQQAQRLAVLEQQISQMLDSQQNTARLLLELPRSTEAVPIETTRAKIQRLINSYCRAKGVSQQDIWRKVYDQLYYAYRVSILSYRRSERESWLDVAERTGHIEKIYAIASTELGLADQAAT